MHGAPLESALSPRQLQVLTMLCEGLSAKEVGAQLRIGQRTVEFHRYAIAQKVGLNSMVLLVRWAIRNKLIDP